MTIFRILASFCVAVLACAGADWTRWGGSDNSGNMYSSEINAPVEFDTGKPDEKGEIDLSTTKNIKWVARLGSQSYGNVTVARGRVFIGTNNEYPRDPRHIGDRSILLCLSEDTGKLLWQLVITKHPAGRAIDWENLGLLSSPTVEGDRVYIVTTRGEVLCLDIEGMKNGNDGPFTDEGNYLVQDTGEKPVSLSEKDADIIWRFNMLDELGILPHNAANGSVLILGNVAYTTTSNGVDPNHGYVPFPFAPSVIALNKFTGELIAEDGANNGKNIFHGQWSSITSGKVNGRDLIFFGGGDGWLYAFDCKPTKEGQRVILPVVWKADCNPEEYKFKNGVPVKHPDPDGPSEIVATPVYYKNRVYVAIGQDPEHGEGVGRLTCWDATKTGDITKSGLIWEFRKIKRSLSTVSIDSGTDLLFIADFSGFVYCLDAENGKHYWTYDMKSHVWGSTLVVDGKVYIADEDGDFVILPAKKDFDPAKEKPLFETNLKEPCYSTPVFANGVLYVSTPSYLYAITNSATKK